MELQASFFDLHNRHKKLAERDPLRSLNRLLDWEVFRAPIEALRSQQRKSKAGRKPFDAVLMFKILILQHLYNLRDDELAFQIARPLQFLSLSWFGPRADRAR